jgi:phosphonate transport system ATP-binding protein
MPTPDSANPDQLFVLKNVSVAYDGEAVLKNISLVVNEGEHVAIFGPSGSGKSTLLRKLLELCPGKAAFIHQDYSLVPQLSVFHNIYAGRLDQNTWTRNIRNLIRPDPIDVALVDTIVEQVGLNGRLWDPVGELSGGQQQRVAVARAVHRGVSVMLADEPVASVDPQQSLAILDILKDSAATVIVALHDVTLGLEAFTRAIGLRDGQIAFDLQADDVTPDVLDSLYRSC